MEFQHGTGDDDFIILCLAPATPFVPFCRDGTTLFPDATTPEIGRCYHQCTGVGSTIVDPEHFCYQMVSTGSGWDDVWVNNTCGIGDCDSHTTRSACEGGEGNWFPNDELNEQPCSNIQARNGYKAYSCQQYTNCQYNTDTFGSAVQDAVQVGEFCCDGFFRDDQGRINGRTFTLDDVDCSHAPREQTCSWPEWNGENTGGVVCELVPGEGCGADCMQCDQSNGCYENWESTCDFEGTMSDDCSTCSA